VSGYVKTEHETLCFTCRYACSTRCSWAWEFTPVEGWTAVETRKGYDVYECPNYVPGRGLSRRPSDEGYMKLLQAAAYQMRDDYIHGRDKGNQVTAGDKRYSTMTARERLVYNAEVRRDNRKSIEKWLLGDGAKLLQLSNPQEVIRQLRKLAAKYEQENAQLQRSVYLL